jgi:Tol biopolymer transport system component
MRVTVADGSVAPIAVRGGAHMSLSPDGSRIADVDGHRHLWISPLGAGDPYPIFEFDAAEVRIDYPVWSPDGRWILFDRWEPEGGDVWLLEGS